MLSIYFGLLYSILLCLATVDYKEGMAGDRFMSPFRLRIFFTGQEVRPSDPLVGEPVEPQRHPRRTQGTPKENLRKIPASSALGLIGIVYFVYSASISALMGLYTIGLS
jgi:hypothetical protein